MACDMSLATRSLPAIKGVYPQQSIMCARSAKYAIGFSKLRVALLEALHETRDSTGTHRQVPTHDHVPNAVGAWDHIVRLTAFPVLDNQQLRRKVSAEALMDFTDATLCCGAADQTTLVDPFLNLDVGLRFQLKVALLRLGAKVVSQGTLPLREVEDEVDFGASGRALEARRGLARTQTHAPVSLHRPWRSILPHSRTDACMTH